MRRTLCVQSGRFAVPPCKVFCLAVPYQTMLFLRLRVRHVYSKVGMGILHLQYLAPTLFTILVYDRGILYT